MNNRHKLTFRFFDTEKQAIDFIKTRGKRKQSMTDWTSTDGKEHKKIVWFYE